MPKFFVENENIKSNKIYITEDYNHIKNVLRKNVGDELEVCNKNNGDNFLCSILNILSEEIECEIIKKVKSEAESKLKVTIFQGLPKQEKMEIVIQKCIELGAYEFVPLEMKNCVVKLKEKDKIKKIERWQKIAEVAAKQCGRDIVPRVNNICNISELINKMKNFDSVIVAYENEENYSIKSEINKLKQKENINKVAIIIGPEGRNRQTGDTKIKRKWSKYRYTWKTNFKNRNSGNSTNQYFNV